MIKSKTNLDINTQGDMVVFLLRRNVLRNAVLAGVVLAAGLTLLTLYLCGVPGLKEITIWVNTLAAVVVLCVLLVYLMVYFTHKPKQERCSETVMFEFGETDIKYQILNGEVFAYKHKLDYAFLKGVYETKDYFFVVANAQNILCVSKAGFEKEEDIAALRESFKSVLKKRFKVR
ncbi:MAG: YcxB family protein [Firmicutes bacterium]|nr:YcxB family protein [Bacillota bacterium]